MDPAARTVGGPFENLGVDGVPATPDAIADRWKRLNRDHFNPKVRCGRVTLATELQAAYRDLMQLLEAPARAGAQRSPEGKPHVTEFVEANVKTPR